MESAAPRPTHPGSDALWIGTSWKMNGTARSTREYCAELVAAGLASWRGVQPFVVPAATAIREARTALGPSSGVLVGAQNAHWADAGAWTGEISVPQVADAGAELVELGHSERREHFGETDRTVNLKVKAVLAHGLRPLVCVGEPRAVLEARGSVPYVCDQVDAALDGVADASRVLVAYEPVWAIGERGRPPRDGELDAVCGALAERFGSRTTALLYGGSVDARNARRLLGLPGVTGLFVGRAAWQAAGFLEILRVARQAATQRPEGVAAGGRAEEGGSGAPVRHGRSRAPLRDGRGRK